MPIAIVFVAVGIISSTIDATINCGSKELKPDFYTRYTDGSIEVILDGFNAEKNAKIFEKIREESRIDLQSEIRQLHFLSFGYPKLVSPRKCVGDFKALGASPYGFYVNIQTLTPDKRLILIKKIAKIYGVTADVEQINDILLTELTCKLECATDEKNISISGSAKNLRSFPLRVDFKLRKGTFERMAIESGNITEMELICDAVKRDSSPNFAYHFMIYLEAGVQIAAMKPVTTTPHPYYRRNY